MSLPAPPTLLLAAGGLAMVSGPILDGPTSWVAQHVRSTLSALTQ